MANQTAERPNRNEVHRQSDILRRSGEESTPEDFYELVSEISDSCERYCAKRPRVVAGVLFALGFVLGWKLKPW